MSKIGFSETPSEAKTKQKSAILNRLTGFLFAAALAVVAVQIGVQCIASGLYIKHVFEQLIIKGKSLLLSWLTAH
jgi:hypothetical protein